MEILPETGTLHTVAQVAITLVGFTGIVIAYGERARENWTAEETLRLYTMLYPTMTAFFCSFVPIVLIYFSVSIETTWRLSNAVLGLAHGINLTVFLLEAKGKQITLGQKLNATFGISVVLAHFLACLAIVPWQQAIFIFGLLQQIFIGIHNFMLLFRPDTNERAK